ncbi:MAG TPA: hypothetical protein VGN37_26530 [Actinocatenispora sp.]
MVAWNRSAARVEPPAGTPGRGAQRRLGERLVRAQGTAVPGGERGAIRRMEQDEPAAGTGDARQLAQPGDGVRQVAEQAGLDDGPYAGRSSPNRVSQVAARVAKKARPSAAYQRVRVASGGATCRIAATRPSCRCCPSHASGSG